MEAEVTVGRLRTGRGICAVDGGVGQPICTGLALARRDPGHRRILVRARACPGAVRGLGAACTANADACACEVASITSPVRCECLKAYAALVSCCLRAWSPQK